MGVARYMRLAGVLVFGACTFVGGVFAQKAGQHKVSVQAKLSQDYVHAGSMVEALLLVTIHDGWHINSATPTDENSIETSVEVDSKIATLTDVRFPPGEEKEFDFADEPLSVYEGNIQIHLTLDIATDLKPGTYTLPVALGYQACDDKICLAPATLRVDIPISVVPATQRVSRINLDLFEKK